MGIVNGFIFFTIFSLVLSDELEIENGVLVLNNDNFDDIISTHKPILVNFYAPWCKFSQQLLPHFENAAQNILKSNKIIKLGKVDVTVETELAERFGIKQYPTLFLMKEDRQISYKKANNHIIITQWLISKIENLILEVSSTNILEELKQKFDVLVIVNWDTNITMIEHVAESIDDIQFAKMKPSLFNSLYSFAKETPIVLLRKVDNNSISFLEELTKENVEKFVKMNELPHVVKYSFQIGGKVFSNSYKHMHLLIFMNDNFDTAIKELLLPANNHPEVSFIVIDVNDNSTTSMINFFKVDTSSLPFILLSDAKYKKQFKPESQQINSNFINEFLNGVKEGKISPFLKSQPIPENWNSDAVKILVGKNFEEIVYDKSKLVFVEFYAPWCNYCKQLAPIWDKLAQELSNVPDLIIAKLDKTENDIKDIEIKSFPVLKLFLKDTNEIVDYTGPRTKEQFKEFLSKYVDLNKKKDNVEL